MVSESVCMCVYVCVHVHMCTHVSNFFTRYRQSLILCESIWLFAIPFTVAFQAPLSMEFSRQEYWTGLPHPSPGCLVNLVNPGIKPRSPTLQAYCLHLNHQGSSKIKVKIHTVMEVTRELKLSLCVTNL